jgi:hypothetical protein
MSDYLPKHATEIEACDWLKAQTGKSWTLARLLENGLMPWFWLDFKPGYPAIFGDRIEGYMAPMVFMSDTQRLEADSTDALVSLTHTHDGVVMKVEPGITVQTKELKFKRDDLEALCKALVPMEVESPKQRRHRWLESYGDGARGAKARVHKEELLFNPKADRSFVGKEIQKAKKEKEAAKRDGARYGQLM